MFSFKRISSLIGIGLLFLTSGCSAQTPQPPTVDGFRCHAVVQYDDLAVEGELTRKGAGLLSFTVSAPASLEGLQLVWDGESVSVTLHGLSFGIDPDQLPASGIGSALLSAFDAAVGISSGEQTADGYVTSGQAASGNFTILSDPQSGYLLSLSMPSLGLTASFSDFRLLSSAAS